MDVLTDVNLRVVRSFDGGARGSMPFKPVSETLKFCRKTSTAKTMKTNLHNLFSHWLGGIFAALLCLVASGASAGSVDITVKMRAQKRIAWEKYFQINVSIWRSN